VTFRQQSLFDAYDIKGADFSVCRTWRYALWRVWKGEIETAKMIAFIGLNPSTADERVDDNTVTRCINFAKGFGFDGMYMLNCYAFRSTNPKGLQTADDAVGPGNDWALQEYSQKAETVVAAWGTICPIEREVRVRKVVGRELMCLKLTKHGRPQHPLYLPGDAVLIPFGM
jgi:hypothetical protein